MEIKALMTTIVSGFLAVVLVICTTALLISGVDVPKEFIPAFLLFGGTAVGASGKATGGS
jgi:hypothetical protein